MSEQNAEMFLEARMRDLVSSDIKKMETNATQGFGKAGAAAKGFGAKASTAFSNAKSEMGGFLKRFGPGILLVAGFSKAMLVLGGSIDFVRERTIAFEKEMSKVQAILGSKATVEGMKQLNEEAKNLGETTAFSASQAAEGFVELAKVGFETNEILLATADILNIAAAAEVELGVASEGTARTLKQFNLEADQAERVTDVMAKSFSSSALDMNRFTESMKFVGATASSLGISLEDTSAGLAVLADRGIAGSMAGTAMRRVLLEMADSGSKASAAISRINPEADTFAEKLQALRDANLTPTEIKNTFGLLASTSADILIKGAGAVQKFGKSFEDARGSAKAMADTMLDNVAGATQLLDSALEGLALAIGEAFGESKRSRIELYTDLTKDAAKWVREHSKQIKAFADGFTSSVKFVIDNLDLMIAATKIFFALWAGNKIVGITKSIFLFGQSFLIATPKVAGMNTAMKAYGVSSKVVATGTKGAGKAMLGLNPILLAAAAAWVAIEIALVGVERSQKRIIESQEKMSASVSSVDTLGKLLEQRILFDELVASGGAYTTVNNRMGVAVKNATPALDAINKKVREFQGSVFSARQTQENFINLLKGAAQIEAAPARKKQTKDQAKIDAELAQLRAEDSRASQEKAQSQAIKDKKTFEQEIASIEMSFLQSTHEGRIQVLDSQREDLLTRARGDKDRVLLIEQEFNRRIGEERQNESDKQLDSFLANIEQEEALLIQQRDLEVSIAQRTADDKKAIDDQSESDRKEHLEKMLSFANAGFQGSTRLLGGFAKLSQIQATNDIKRAKAAGKSEEEIEAIRKKSFEQQQSFQLATAIMNTASAVTNALASAPPPLNFINAAIAGAAGALEVAAISKQKFQTGGLPVGRNANIQVNEAGQEAVLNAGATSRLGAGGVNALNAGQSTQITNEISFSPTIQVGQGNESNLIDVLRESRDEFAEFFQKDVIDRGFLETA